MTGKAKTGGNGAKMSEEKFFTQAIKTLRNGKSNGIHVTYSGFNGAYRDYYGKEPRDAQVKLVEAGKIVIRPCKGGAMMYLAGEEPIAVPAGQAALAKMGITG